VLIGAGVITVIAGVVAIFYPDVTLLALAILAGINLLVLGVVGLVEGLTGDDGSRVLNAILGLIALIAGIVLLRRPGDSLLAFIVILGAWFVVSAVVTLIRAIFVREGRGIRILGGVIELVFGVLILSLPKLSLGTLAVLAGIAFAIRGGSLIASGMALRHAGKAVDSLATTEHSGAVVAPMP
jgi:uncharacterized membrane protein HdeD (DUF308 family)